MQGFDTGSLLISGLDAVKGDAKARDAMVAAMAKTVFDSPRGKFTLSAAHNPVQDIYLRKVTGLENLYVRVAVKDLADPATGCKMA